MSLRVEFIYGGVGHRMRRALVFCRSSLIKVLDLVPLPKRLITWAAESLAFTRELSPYPGWSFASAMAVGGWRSFIRKAIWRYCNHRKMDMPIHIEWYEGIRLQIYLGNDLSKCLFIGGAYEPNEFALLDKEIAEGMVFVDIGANDGLYTLFAAAKVGDEGRVIALEPSRREFARLQANLRLNQGGNVNAYRLGASNYNGFARLNIADYEHEGHNSLGELCYDSTVSHSEEIEVKRLDDLLDEDEIASVDCVKIDVEGAEEAVLAGMRRILAEYKPLLLVEVFEQSLRAQDSSSEMVLEFLRSFGYRLYSFDKSNGKPTPLGDVPVQSENIIAVHESDWERIIPTAC
jgi:FkbM family methyltransferase